MNLSPESTWNTYANAWKAETREQKHQLLLASLAPECEYTDPLTDKLGWDALLDYMLDFHQQIPGGHFITHQFYAHHDHCVAHWSMTNSNDEVLGQGCSHGEFDATGKLVSMIGFFDIPSEVD